MTTSDFAQCGHIFSAVYIVVVTLAIHGIVLALMVHGPPSALMWRDHVATNTRGLLERAVAMLGQ